MTESLDPNPIYVVLNADRQLARGEAPLAAAAARKAAADGLHPVVIFDLASGRAVDLDPSGEIAGSAPARRGPGRPKLGVVAREVTLLPRHWDWLNSQPGGASVALRKLVDEARKSRGGEDARRTASAAAFAFMSTTAGHQPGFEEALRALFAADRARFDQETQDWPADVRAIVREIAAPAFASGADV